MYLKLIAEPPRLKRKLRAYLQGFIEPVEGALVKERASLGLAVIARPFGILETNQLLRTS
jgi:hypothetical protein